jgi:hypothetical protein
MISSKSGANWVGPGHLGDGKSPVASNGTLKNNSNQHPPIDIHSIDHFLAENMLNMIFVTCFLQMLAVALYIFQPSLGESHIRTMVIFVQAPRFVTILKNKTTPGPPSYGNICSIYICTYIYIMMTIIGFNRI